MAKKQVTISLRKPPSDPDKFVAGAPPHPRSADGRLVSTSVGARREMTLFLPAEVARKLSLRCVELARDPSDVVAELLSEALAREDTAATRVDRWSKARTVFAACRAHLPFGRKSHDPS
jgi:hypothetical protein